MCKVVRQGCGLWCLALACLLVGAPAWGQSKTFHWADVLCEYRGTYDTSKYTAQQLQNTYELWFLSSFQLDTGVIVWKPEDISKLNSAPITADYQDKMQRLKALEVVQQPYWIKLREQTVAELEAVYQLSMVTVEGYKTPKVLRKYPAAPQCREYAEALIAGGDEMMTAWEQLSISQCQKNGYPKMCMGRYQQERDSTQAADYAQINLMTFGWWNCNNQSIPHVEHDGNSEAEFRKLFKRVRYTCDEP